MALYTDLASLSQTAGSNAADGTTDAPSTIDNNMNLLASFIAQLRDGVGFTGAGQGRLSRITAYYRIAGVQNVSVDGGAPTTTGANFFTALPTTLFAIAEGTGAGGGSGGNPTTTAAQQVFSAGGGGGSFGIGRFPAPLSSIPITVGAAGTAGGLNGAGGNGGATIFGTLMSVPGGLGSPAGIAGGAVWSVGGTNGGALPTGANIVGKAGGGSAQILSAALGFVTGQTGGPSGSGTPNGFGTGAGGKYNGPSTASPQIGFAAPDGGLLIIWEYA